MEKRYQVFVSSTFRDLRHERSQVLQTLLELDCIPTGMELFCLSDGPQWELIRRVIDDCDYYLLIIGDRYGTTDEDGISYTEKEFDYAVEKQKPILVFPAEAPEQVSHAGTEADEATQEKLNAFRERATRDRIVRTWTTQEDLAGKVARGLIHLIKTQPAEGWVRARYASDLETLLRLQKRIEQLESEWESLRTAQTQDAQVSSRKQSA